VIANCSGRFPPAFFALETVANEYVAESAPAGDIVSIVFVLNTFEAG
jgi:hypothetical protein